MTNRVLGFSELRKGRQNYPANKKWKHGGVYVSRPNGALGVPIWESLDVKRAWDHQN